jgi:hypothetical protein
MKKVLIDGVTATDATKIQFELESSQFTWGLPVIRGTGFLSGDVSKLWVLVNGIWQNTGLVLSDTVFFLEFLSFGTYAVDITVALTNAVSVELEASSARR